MGWDVAVVQLIMLESRLTEFVRLVKALAS